MSSADVGRKLDDGKARWDLMPWRALSQIQSVLDYGANKYAQHNWKKVPNARERYFSAAMRHLVAWWSGASVDPESGHSHLAHAGCCILFLLAFDSDTDQSDACQPE